MNRTMLQAAGGVALAALAGAMVLYAVHPVRGSDHQDSPTMIGRPAADITDVFAFPPPTASQDSNIVLVMDVLPLIPMGQVEHRRVRSGGHVSVQDRPGHGYARGPRAAVQGEQRGHRADAHHVRTGQAEFRRHELDVHRAGRHVQLQHARDVDRERQERPGLRRTTRGSVLLRSRALLHDHPRPQLSEPAQPCTAEPRTSASVASPTAAPRPAAITRRRRTSCPPTASTCCRSSSRCHARCWRRRRQGRPASSKCGRPPAPRADRRRR